MAFDSTKPVDHAEIIAGELRNQFNALKALIDAQQAQMTAQQTQIAALQASLAAKATAVSSIPTNDLTISDPPGIDEMNTLYDKVKAIINGMR